MSILSLCLLFEDANKLTIERKIIRIVTEMYGNGRMREFNDDFYDLRLTWFWYNEMDHCIYFSGRIWYPEAIYRNNRYCFDMGDGWMEMVNLPYSDMQ